MRIIANLIIIIGVLAVPIAASLTATYGVTGYQLDSLNPEDERAEWLAMSAEDREMIIGDRAWDRISTIYGKLSAKRDPETGDPIAETFLWVPEDYLLTTDQGESLIVVPRSAGKEWLQARSLRNISILVSIGLIAGGLFLFVIDAFRRRRRARATAASE